MTYSSETIRQINNSINIVDYASQYLDLEKRGDEYWSVCPFHKDVNASLSFNAEKNVYNCLGCSAKGGIINFAMAYHKWTFPQTMENLIKYADITIIPKQHSDVMEFLYKNNGKKHEQKIIVRDYLADNVMTKYAKEPIKEWTKEGISQEVLDLYEVRYDKANNNIVFPIRDMYGNIIAIKARTLYEDYNSLGIRKYSYYQKIGTNDWLFGLYNNLYYIKEANEVIVVESEKSVMKLASFGIKNAVAIGTKNIKSNYAQKTLLLSLKEKIVFAFDKDVVEKEIVEEIKDFAIFTDVYYIIDTDGLLDKKESPCDKGYDVWKKLYESRRKIERRL